MLIFAYFWGFVNSLLLTEGKNFVILFLLLHK